VALGKVQNDKSDFVKRSEPGNPAADATGHVKYLNVTRRQLSAVPAGRDFADRRRRRIDDHDGRRLLPRGVQIAAPFLVFGLLFNVGLGILARLMPQLQVFFLGLPVSIMIGFLLMMLLVGGLMSIFLGYIGGVLGELVRQ
jgi:flagellar biosynthesis protein FliR